MFNTVTHHTALSYFRLVLLRKATKSALDQNSISEVHKNKNLNNKI